MRVLLSSHLRKLIVVVQFVLFSEASGVVGQGKKDFATGNRQ
jgi:hypothetical protein